MDARDDTSEAAPYLDGMPQDWSQTLVDHTAVTWTMTGKKNFVAKAFQLFMSMDRMVGGYFEQGLAQMKAVVERNPR